MLFFFKFYLFNPNNILNIMQIIKKKKKKKGVMAIIKQEIITNNNVRNNCYKEFKTTP